MALEKKTEVIHSEDYKGFKIEILLEKGNDFKNYKIVINGNSQSTKGLDKNNALKEAYLIVEEMFKKKQQKRKRSM